MNKRILRLIVYGVGMLFVSIIPVQRVLASNISVTTGSDPIANGVNFEAALNNAKCGDTIILQAGATYLKATTGSFILHNKGVCSGTDADYITIQTSATLPEGRLDPKKSGASLAKIRNTSNWAIQQEVNAHHYKLIGLDISKVDGSTTYTADLVHWGTEGTASGGYTTASELRAAKNFIIDRCFIHPAEITSGQLVNNDVLTRTSGRGMALNGVDVTVVNSYIAGFTGYIPGTKTKIDAYGIYVTIGPGPITIKNNYLEAAFNGIFLGGGGSPTDNTATLSGGATTSRAIFSNVNNLAVGDYIALQLSSPYQYSMRNIAWGNARVTAIDGLAVSYVGEGATGLPVAPATPGLAKWKGVILDGGTTIQKNTFYKQPQWAIDFPGIGKASIEIKQLVNGVIDGNVIDGTPKLNSGIGFMTRNQGGDTPWMKIANVTMSNNLFRIPASITLMLMDSEATSTIGGNITITNNLIPTNPTYPVIKTSGGDTVLISHNTFRISAGWSLQCLDSTTMSYGQDRGMHKLTWKDNIFDYSNYGKSGTSGCWPDFSSANNVVVNSQGVTSPDPVGATQFPNSTQVASDNEVGFVNYISADAMGDYHGFALKDGTRFKGKASDGKDPGVDFTALDAALPPALYPPPKPAAK